MGRITALGILVATLVASCLVLATRPAYAATITVDRTDDPDPATASACTDTDPNDCSLRGAIVAANEAGGADAITVPAGTYTLTRAGEFEDAASTGDLDVTGELTITGTGARTTTVAGGPAPYEDRIFENRPGAKATITGLTITGGNAVGYEGGGVRNLSDLTLDGVVVKDNIAGFSGGVYNDEGDLTLRKVTVKDNTANVNGAGGIFSSGTLNLIDSTVSGNSATSLGGLYLQAGGTANITNSTISGNKTTTQAGFSSGVAAEGALVNIRNSTIASNTSGRLGGGILTTTGATVFVKNTIVASNSQDNCNDTVFGGAISSQGNNLSTDDTCPFTKTTDKQNTNPRLGPLANNGGPTDTRALLDRSPAIDAGTNTGCPTTDQRGVARPQRGTCDIGAFERQNSAPSANDDAYGAREDTTLARPAPGVLANNSDPEGDVLRASLVRAPRKGTLALRADGSFVYRPRANLSGADSFTYRASDGHGGTDTATVTINIASVNDAPVVTPISPAAGASTSDRTPLIRARARDVETDLSEANVRLFVDGVGVPASRFAYDRDTDVLSYTPPTALAVGNHAVKVVATDAEGRSTTKQWSFKVL